MGYWVQSVPMMTESHLSHFEPAEMQTACWLSWHPSSADLLCCASTSALCFQPFRSSFLQPSRFPGHWLDLEWKASAQHLRLLLTYLDHCPDPILALQIAAARVKMCAAVAVQAAPMRKDLLDSQLTCFSSNNIDRSQQSAAKTSEILPIRHRAPLAQEGLTCAGHPIRGLRARLAHEGRLVPRGRNCLR